MLGMFGFILGGIGCLIYCGRTKTFLFYSGMKYHSITRINIGNFWSKIFSGLDFMMLGGRSVWRCAAYRKPCFPNSTCRAILLRPRSKPVL